MENSPVCGRFAPSPSGRMHLGNLWSCLLAWLSARSVGGRMVLRLASLTGDMEVLSQAQRAARELLERDPALSRPESRVVLERVRVLFTETPDIFN